jgi:N-acetylglutamate synthase-like GNAT family acetyltransferase
MSEQIVYEDAAAEDWPAIEALLVACELPLEGAKEAPPSVVVAQLDNEVIGCAALEKYGASGLLRSVAVTLAWRGQGVAREMTARLLDAAHVAGLTDVTLLTTTAVDYFPRLSFATVARKAAPEAVRASVEFRDACPASATVMTRALFWKTN